MKTKIVFSFFFFCCFIFSCRYFIKPNALKSGALYTEEFRKMSREEQVKKCGECHSKEYENEIAGPHSAAFKKLTDHKTFVNDSTYTCSFYTKHVNDKYGADCMHCHAPENLFEGLFKQYQNSDSLIKALLDFEHPPLVERSKTADRVTGIDCISCHFDGTGVLSNNEKFKQPSSASCNPKFAAFYKNVDITCMPCHTDEYKSLSTLNTAKSSGKECLSCHMEFDNSGKSNHYYYWYLDKPERQSNIYTKMLESFSFQKSSDNSTSYITCNNNFLPHQIGLCPELILNFEIMNKDSVVLGKTTVRLNRKTEFDAMMYDYFGKKYLGGVTGTEPPIFTKPAKYPIRVSKVDKATLMRISIVKKQQYWFADSLGFKTLTGIVSVN